MRRTLFLFACALGAAAFAGGCASQQTSLPGSPLPPGAVKAARVAAAQSGCRFDSSRRAVSVAFCETFDRPAGIRNRAGELNGTLWGVSRQLGYTNFGQGQYNATSPTTIDRCGTMLPAQPPGDVQICNGRLVEAQTDNENVTSLAMYPKQPFDFAGRTGTIVFDVSDDSQGTHRAWPELWMSDLPVPVPFVHFTSLQSDPANGFGVRFAAFCPANVPGCGLRPACPEQPLGVPIVGVDSAIVVNHYVSDDSSNGAAPGPIRVRQTDCVKASSGPGHLNHFELRISPARIDVYGTDAGTTSPLRHIAIIDNMHLSFTRGLVWLEDAHYNANKEGFGKPQGTHTFAWDNLGFDGPLLPRDLAFDVLDRLEPIAGGLLNLGWMVGPTSPAPLTLEAEGVYGASNASAAFVTFNFVSSDRVTIRYRLNAGAWSTMPWPYPRCYHQNGQVACGLKTIAVPVSLADVRPGTNAIAFESSDDTAFFNVDLILKGAAGVPPPP